MAQVTLTDIHKRYGTVQAVKELDLEIQDRELMVLVGPSGCGKSTVLRMIAGLEDISNGELSIGKSVVNDTAPKDRDIAMVFQSYALYPHMSVRENLEFGLKLRKINRAEIDRRVSEAAEMLGLQDLLDRKPKQMSGGQRQRVAIGRAIVRKPKVFLFDEPLSNLDASLRSKMRAEISRIQRRLQTTTVYVTHDQVEAMTLGDRIAVLDNGRLQQVDSPLNIYERPANTFVATFIGTPPMNIFPARIADAHLEIGTSHLPIPPQWQQATTSLAGSSLVVGIRPENLHFGEEEPTASQSCVPCNIEMIEPLGHEVLIHGKIGKTSVAARTTLHGAPDAGQKHDLKIDMNHIHLFDAETQQRL